VDNLPVKKQVLRVAQDDKSFCDDDKIFVMKKKLHHYPGAPGS